jgi:acyl-coenzyme A synthetase/AMP-(fatty) acid ligase
MKGLPGTEWAVHTLRRQSAVPSAQAASAALAGELQEWVKSRLAPYKYPRWIDFISELPKTATGKIQRFKLRQG